MIKPARYDELFESPLLYNIKAKSKRSCKPGLGKSFRSDAPRTMPTSTCSAEFDEVLPALSTG